jgi:hypothetical protein
MRFTQACLRLSGIAVALLLSHAAPAQELAAAIRTGEGTKGEISNSYFEFQFQAVPGEPYSAVSRTIRSEMQPNARARPSVAA